MDLTEHHDLRSGDPVWVAHAAAPPNDPPPAAVDVAIVGAGIMGAMLADRLAASGRSVALLDRRPPASGSTAASTALVMWEIDVPLTHLARAVGLEEAGRRWRRGYEAVARLQAKVRDLRLDAHSSPTAYLAGTLLDDEGLRAELAARTRFALPSEWLDAKEIADRFGIAPRAALVSTGGFAVDPVQLTLALIARARAAGAAVSWPVDVTRLESRRDGRVALIHDGGEVVAKQAILAGGYERATAFLPPAFALMSSYAVATAPGTAPLWREDAMIWEASTPYLYLRSDAAGRIIAGGEDEHFAAPGPRDHLLEAKSGTIAAKLAALLGVADIAIDRRWSATFGTSPDGLPAIGRAANHESLWLASGFGGNGISFAALASELLAAALDGTPDPMAPAFDPYRFA